ncbi:hypothetical protein [Bradyrhizobium sp. USDA 3650]
MNEGRTNSSELQADLGRGDQDRLIYFAFELQTINQLLDVLDDEAVVQAVEESKMKSPPQNNLANSEGSAR